MSIKKRDRSGRIKSLFENEIFLNELERIMSTPAVEDYGYDVEVIKLRHRWKLTWEYHETLTNYIETGKIDYEFGDKDIKVINYRAGELTPSVSPKNEFSVMNSLRMLGADHPHGVYLKLPKELTQTDLKDFVANQYDLIEKALDDNYPERIKRQAPEQQSKRKVKIFRMHEEGVPIKQICNIHNCESSYVYQVVKEYKEKIKG